jgi:aminopeptidase N
VAPFRARAARPHAVPQPRRTLALLVPGLVLALCGFGAAQVVAAAAAPGVRPALGTPAGLEPARDYHTYANTHEFRVQHLDLALDVDFEAKRLSGAVDLRLERLAAEADRVVLDTNGLVIRRAWLVDGEAVQPLEFRLDDGIPVLGRPLVLTLPESVRGRSPLTVRISYQTTPQAQGLQWLTPAQTAGKRHPFLFSQSQSIYARTWIPLQDTPQVRYTYTARITTPKALRAVMGAVNDAAAPLDGDFAFEMPQPIPSYLMAIAVGELEFRATGPRSGVYAEPSVVERAAREFVDTERMIEAGERLFGPYRWGRYDILVLPPSFPYGGMENPRLTFATPTILAGDRSLVALIAHELAHSWSGNLVTNASWRDFWLNEGFTVFAESKIQGELYGAARRAQEDALGAQSLVRELARLAPRDQVLAVDLRERGPEEGFTPIPYEKGRFFLNWLESRAGEERFMAWLRGYFDHFAFRSLHTEQFLEYLEATLVARSEGRIRMDEVREWVYGPGLPQGAVLATSDAFERVDAERGRFLAGTPAAALATQGWTTQQWQHFLDGMPRTLARAQLGELDAAFGFTRSDNAEIEFSWFRNVIRNRYEPAYARLEQYLVGIGRRKLIKPLYEDLMATGAENAAFARRVYALARPGYHPIAQTSIDAVVK